MAAESRSGRCPNFARASCSPSLAKADTGGTPEFHPPVKSSGGEATFVDHAMRLPKIRRMRIKIVADIVEKVLLG